MSIEAFATRAASNLYKEYEAGNYAAKARFSITSEQIQQDANAANEMFDDISCAILEGIAVKFGVSPEELMSFSWWSSRMWAYGIENYHTPVTTITFKLFEEDETEKGIVLE